MRRKKWVLCLLGGMAINVVMAWSIGIWAQPSGYVQLRVPPLATMSAEAKVRPGEHVLWDRYDAFGFNAYMPSINVSEVDRFDGYVAPGYNNPELRVTGWPMRSMQSMTRYVRAYKGVDRPRRWDLPVGEIVRRGMQTAWVPALLHPHMDGRIALVPIPLGFVVNTSIYALAVAALFKGVAWLKSKQSQPRGFDIILPGE
ncbi:MAG: hypothetical protein JWM57_1784 [Phycisphaerales bacterium]|nr:hypothetical protein [Phycisphaerales bacterium]